MDRFIPKDGIKRNKQLNYESTKYCSKNESRIFSVITMSVNVLNSAFRRQRLSDCIGEKSKIGFMLFIREIPESIKLQKSRRSEERKNK